MNNRKIVCDRREPRGTPLLIDLGKDEWLFTTTAIERSKRKLDIKLLCVRKGMKQ